MTLLDVMLVKAFHYLETSYLRDDECFVACLLRDFGVFPVVALPKLEVPYVDEMVDPLEHVLASRDRFRSLEAEALIRPVDNLLYVVSVASNNSIDEANFQVQVVVGLVVAVD